MVKYNELVGLYESYLGEAKEEDFKNWFDFKVKELEDSGHYATILTSSDISLYVYEFINGDVELDDIMVRYLDDKYNISDKKLVGILYKSKKYICILEEDRMFYSYMLVGKEKFTGEGTLSIKYNNFEDLEYKEL